MSEKIEANSERRSAWDMVSLEQMQKLSRRDDCLDIMVPSDLRHIVGRYAEAVAALKGIGPILAGIGYFEGVDPKEAAKGSDSLGTAIITERQQAVNTCWEVITKAGGLS